MYEKYIKRLLDIFTSLLLLPILFVAFLIIGLLIKLEDHGPVFTQQSALVKAAVFLECINSVL